jgi:hypothetical protein
MDIPSPGQRITTPPEGRRYKVADGGGSGGGRVEERKT